jgi:glycosyltransferase involved in cell wall biosynthesis
LSRVLPELGRAGVAVTVLARAVTDPYAFGVVAEQVEWGGDEGPPDPAAAKDVARVIETLQPDVVLLSNVYDVGVLRAVRAAPRVVARIHDHRMFCPHGDRIYPQFRAVCRQPMGTACVVNAVVHGCVQGIHPATLRRLHAREHQRDAVREFDAITVGSDFMARSCARNGIERDRIAVLPPPIDPRSLDAIPAPLPADRRVLFAGRLVRDKGLRSLVRAVGLIPRELRPILDVAGKPTAESASIEELAPKLGVQMNLLGRLTPKQIDRAIDAARAVAVPSLWPEPFGMVGIEAQARGRPAVAYAVGGIPEWIAGAGIAVPRGDEHALAEAIVEVLDDTRWHEYAVVARGRASAYLPSAHVAKLLEVCF